MTSPQVSIPALLFIAGLGLLSPRAGAVTLDWDSVDWRAGRLTRSFNVDGVAGNDVTITISGNTSEIGSPAGCLTGFSQPLSASVKSA